MFGITMIIKCYTVYNPLIYCRHSGSGDLTTTKYITLVLQQDDKILDPLSLSRNPPNFNRVHFNYFIHCYICRETINLLVSIVMGY